MPTSEIMNYLSLGCIMSGLDGLFSSLYGVSLHAVEMEPGEAWHYNVHKLVSIMRYPLCLVCLTLSEFGSSPSTEFPFVQPEES